MSRECLKDIIVFGGQFVSWKHMYVWRAVWCLKSYVLAREDTLLVNIILIYIILFCNFQNDSFVCFLNTSEGIQGLDEQYSPWKSRYAL